MHPSGSAYPRNFYVLGGTDITGVDDMRELKGQFAGAPTDGKKLMSIL